MNVIIRLLYLCFIPMPPKSKDYLEPLVWRNPMRKFARSSEVPIATCRDCLWKVMCLENEKNPVIRKLVLGEPIPEEDDEGDFIKMMRDCAL